MFQTIIDKPGEYSGELGRVLIKAKSGEVVFKDFSAEEITNYDPDEGWYPGAAVVCLNGTFTQVNPNVRGQGVNRALWFNGAAGLTVHNCELDGTRGIWAQEINGAVSVKYNRAKNLNSAGSDGNGGYLFSNAPAYHDKDWGPNCQFIILMSTVGQDVEIAWNYIYGEPYKMLVEDTINIASSRGTQDNPIRIHNNMIDGAFAEDPLNADTSMGMMQFEGGDCAYVDVYENFFARGSNVGMSVSWADNIRLFDNIVRCSGEILGGRIEQIWHAFHLFNPGWQKPVNNCEAFRNDVSMPRFWDGKVQGTEIHVEGGMGNSAYENIIDGVTQGQSGDRVFATPEDEAELTRRFWEKVEAAGVTIGNGEVSEPPQDDPDPDPDPYPDPQPDPDPNPDPDPDIDPATFRKKDLIAHRNTLRDTRKRIQQQIATMNQQIKQM